MINVYALQFLFAEYLNQALTADKCRDMYDQLATLEALPTLDTDSDIYTEKNQQQAFVNHIIQTTHHTPPSA